MSKRNPILPIIVFLVLSYVAVPATQAQIIYSEFMTGSFNFDYSQWPYGPLVGNFLANGPVWNPDLTFPPGQTSGCGGGISGAVGDTTRAVATAVIENADGTHDAALAFVTFLNGPVPGSYPVDAANMTTAFVWLDDVANLTIPQEGDDYLAWFNSLQANHRFGSTSGTILVTAAGQDGFAGSFSGMMADPDDFTLLSLTNGQFQMQSVIPSAVPQAPARVSLTAAPNPFNPQTTVKLSLETADHVSVEVFNLAGHRVANLFNGHLQPGVHQWVWDGLNQAGIPQSGGIYFCHAQGVQWNSTTKLVLVP